MRKPLTARHHGFAAVLILAALALLPAGAHAHYPYDSPPPAWWTESTDSSCQVTESFGQGSFQPGVTHDAYTLSWSSPGRSHCFKDVPDPNPAVGFYCVGRVTHFHHSNGSSGLETTWICGVGPGDFRDAYCLRYDINGEDVGYWYVPGNDYFDVGPPCDPADFTQSPDAQGDDAACERAKQRVKRAKKKLQQADSPDAREEARKRLKKAKKRKQEACG